MNRFAGVVHRPGSQWAENVQVHWWPDREQRVKVWHHFRATMKAQELRQEKKITRTAEAVMRALLFEFLNVRNGKCFPSVETIAKAIRASTRAVQYALELLDGYGFIRRHRRRVVERVKTAAGLVTFYRQTSNLYTFMRVGEGCKINPQTPMHLLIKGFSTGLTHWIGRVDRQTDQIEEKRQRQIEELKRLQPDMF